MPDNRMTSRDRAHGIAAMHGAAAWFAEHPGEQLPDAVQHRTVISHADEIDPALREAGVTQFAERHGVPVERSGTLVWAQLVLAAAEHHGTEVTYVVMTDTAQPAGWR